MKLPKRIAILLPELHSDAEPAVRRAAELIIWGALSEAAALHPGLAVTDIGETWLDRLDGQLSPSGATRTTADENAQLSQERRDEIVYLEATLDKPGLARLHVLSSNGERRSFEALGQNLGEQIGRVLSAWLHAGGLAELLVEHFSADDLLGAARALAAALEAAQRPEATLDQLVEKLAPVLKLPALRILSLAVEGDPTPHLAALDPRHPSVRLTEYRVKAERGQRDWNLLRQIVAATPGWATPWLELKNDPKDPSSPSRLEALGAAGRAVFLDPRRRAASEQLADALGNDRRRDEALRASARGVALHDYEPQAHIGMLDRYLNSERLGDWLSAAHRAGWMHGCPMDSPYPWTANQVTIDLCVSTALLNNGRLDEAIALRKNRLELASGNWARAQKTLDGWCKDPRFVAWSYAREGYARGEDARTVEGFSRVEPADGIDVGMFLDAMVATGREREVPYAWAQFGLGRRFNTAYARLSAARALFAAGEWKTGIEELFAFELQFPSRDDHAAVAHAARLLTAAPREVLDGAIAERTQAGAHTLARALDRTIADFTGHSPLPPPARPIWFDPAWLSHFAADTRSRAAVDSLFAETFTDRGDGDAQSRADHLVNRWNQVVFVEASSEDKPNLAQATAYVAAQSLSRYLALTTQAPTVLAGACRTVAAESLQALHALRDHLRDADLAALLSTFEPLIDQVDEQLVEHWLAALERALRLDERWLGRVNAPAKLAAHLFGPESLAQMSLRAAELVREKPDGWAAETATLCARLTWLTGRTGVDEWSLAVETLGGDNVDTLLTCAAIARWRIRAPAVRAGRALFAAGNKEAAFRVLVDGVGAELEGYKDPAVLALEEPWTRSGLDVPFGFKEAVTQAFDLGQKSQPALAARLLSWPCALDSNNAEAQRNLGLFLAQQNRVFEALERLIRATRDEGTQLCAGILYQAGHVPSALAVLDYASRWYLRSDQWLTYGGIVYGAMDNPRTVRAYSLAWELDPDAFDASQLNGYAGVLDEVGDYLTCEKIAQKLIDVAGDDPTWISNGALQMACALVGQGRFDEALPQAELAARVNPLPANAALCQTILERARTRTKAEVPPPLPSVSTREEWFALMDRGDLKQAAELVRDASWRARRAGLRAASFRFTSENQIPVTQRARDAADLVLDDSRGKNDLDALIARALALTLRAQAAFPRDPVPQLGDRMTREAFYAEFRARGGVVLGEAPEEKPAFVDREVAPNQPIATASAYIALLRDLARLTPRQALAAHHLDEAGYLEVAKTWAAVFDTDATLWETIASGLRS